MWYLVSYRKGRAEAQDLYEHGHEKNIWTTERRNIRKEKITSSISLFYLPRHTVMKLRQTTSAGKVLGPMHGPNEKCKLTLRVKT